MNYLQMGIAAAIGLLIIGLAGYAAEQHMEVLKQETLIAEQKGQISSLGLELGHQNDSVKAWKAAADEATADAHAAKEKAEKEAARHVGERTALQALLAAKTPVKADGTTAGCREAWQEILKKVRP